MSEWSNAIDYYSQSGFEMYETTRSREEWSSKEQALAFAKKYWLTTEQQESVWASVFSEVFVEAPFGLNDLVFADGFVLMPFVGGSLFTEEDYEALRRCMLALGEDTFAVIENTFGGRLKEPQLCFAFPTSLTWADLTSGAFLSTALLGMMHKDFYVLGNSGKWGKYLGNDYQDCIEVLGFRPVCSDIFLAEFSSKDEAVAKSLPASYMPKLFRAGSLL